MTRPRLNTDLDAAPGLAALALFAVLGYVFITARFGAPAGFPEGSVTASIGYAMFDLVDLEAATIDAERFLIAFEVIDLVLVAALVAAVMLGRRESDGGSLAAPDDEAKTDGGRPTTDAAPASAPAPGPERTSETADRDAGRDPSSGGDR